MLKQIAHNQKGIIFVTVIMIIIVMMVLVVTAINMNVSQTILTDSEVKRVQAEILAKGALIRMADIQQTALATNTLVYTETIDDINFTITANRNTAGPTLFNTDNLAIQVSYP